MYLNAIKFDINRYNFMYLYILAVSFFLSKVINASKRSIFSLQQKKFFIEKSMYFTYLVEFKNNIKKDFSEFLFYDLFGNAKHINMQ